MASFRHSFLSALLLGAAVFVSSSPVDTSFMPRQASSGFSGCSYPGYTNCNTKDNRGCWVKKGSKTYSIDTDYEDDFPVGITRTFNFEISEKAINADGYAGRIAQVVNGQFPGPQIEACWGDTIVVNVKNTVKNNGTTVHFHGARMLKQNHFDGVNAVTQCPIAQGDSFQYKFQVQQYGNSWYHSHYSSQYGDGVFGSMLIHGPKTANYDLEAPPILVHDWHHLSAYKAFTSSLTSPTPPAADTIVLNGVGFNLEKQTGSYFQQTLEKNKKYLFHVVNTAVDFHFHFSIDNHMLQVVSADYVPIEPFWTNSLSVGVGQRYGIIITTNQTASANGKYWIRTDYASGNIKDSTWCQFEQPHFPINQTDTHRVGMISYAGAGSGNPTTSRWDVQPDCKDPIITPHVKWTVTAPQNDIIENAHTVGLERDVESHGAFRWQIAPMSMWLNYSNPTILNLDNSTWNPEYAVIPESHNNPEGFVYLILNSGGGSANLIGGTHPIHLHGHDFAVVSSGNAPFDPSNPTYNLNNPPRRDTAMLTNGGHLVLAYKTDNPGTWLLHCHIGWHAGAGMSVQIVERQKEITSWLGGPQALDQARRGCKNWDSFLARNRGTGVFAAAEQDDSGI